MFKNFRAAYIEHIGLSIGRYLISTCEISESQLQKGVLQQGFV
jgi:hypothetical protein